MGHECRRYFDAETEAYTQQQVASLRGEKKHRMTMTLLVFVCTCMAMPSKEASIRVRPTPPWHVLNFSSRALSAP